MEKKEINVYSLLHRSQLAIELRWFYAPLMFLIAILSRPEMTTLRIDTALFSLIVIVLAINFFFHLWLEKGEHRRNILARIHIVNPFQIGVDLVYFFLLLLWGGEAIQGFGQLIYLIPIFLSALLFGTQSSLRTGILASILVVFGQFCAENWGYLHELGIYNLEVMHTQGTVHSIRTALIVTLFITAGYLSAKKSKFYVERNIHVAEKVHTEEGHVRQLQQLTKEFDESAKLLVRRDLELMKANLELSRLDDIKSEIISVAAHQLRTPLSAVKWSMKMLIDGDIGTISNEQKAMLMKGYESNERMVSLVNDMLSADRLESGKFKYHFYPIQIEDLIDNIVTEQLNRAHDRDVQIKFTRETVSLPLINIDPEKIRDVLVNLIDNAIKYSHKGGVVTITATQQITDHKAALLISVEDQGIGIPKEDSSKIFGRFFRAQNALRTETDGSGLGLFIARGIIERHGGQIWFDSVEGKGTTIHISIPLTERPAEE